MKCVLWIALCLVSQSVWAESHSIASSRGGPRPVLDNCEDVGAVKCQPGNKGSVAAPKYYCESDNFVVDASVSHSAYRIAMAAETSLCELAVYWNGKRYGKLIPKAPIHVTLPPKDRQFLSGSGQTSYQTSFIQNHRGEIVSRNPPTDWRMDLLGNEKDLLKDVIPHEVNHMIMAMIYRREIPLWANEGISVRQESFQQQQIRRTKIKTSLQEFPAPRILELLNADTYPEVLEARQFYYSLSYSLVDSLMKRSGGKKSFLRLLNQRLSGNSWAEAFRRVYGFENLGEVEKFWHQSIGVAPRDLT